MAELQWAFMSKKVIGRQDNPMLVRWRLIQTPWFGIYLHFIHREDLDRMPHDHPWTFWSVMLRGSYIDEYHPDARQLWSDVTNRTFATGMRPWWRRVRHFPLGAAHRIVHVEGKVTTLVFVGRKQRTWGFYDPTGNFIDWREYHNAPVGWSPSQRHPGVMA